MIKVNATINGTISRAAVVRTNRSATQGDACQSKKEGKAFTTFGVAVVLIVPNGINKTIEVSVIKDDNENTAAYVVGQRIEMTGELTFRKKDENMYFNFAAETINHNPTTNEDSIKGELLMKGSCGKTIEQKTTKNGKQMLVFSAYSSTKEADGFVFTWVRFVQFDATQPDWLQPKATLEAKGEMELSVYNDRINLGCKLSELKQWDKPIYIPRDTTMKPQDETEAMPF